MTLTTVLLTIAGLGVLTAGGEPLVRGASGIAAAATREWRRERAH